MLAVSPLRRTKDEIKSQGEMGVFSSIVGEDEEFGEFSDGSLLESIDFDDIFVGINVGAGDELPDFEMDPEILFEFSMESSENMNCSSLLSLENNNDNGADQHQNSIVNGKEEDEEEEDCNNKASSASASNSGSSRAEEEIMNKRDETATATSLKPSATTKEGEQKGRKSSRQSKNSQGKRKVKVDWTPELHRRFVQAVEQLGVDKAVPSKILEIMGITSLTRHNIASHLQKYRSHRKHLLAREAEAARWNKGREVRPWAAAATVGFPHMAPPPSPSTMLPQYFRPLHVWGHPSMDHYSFMARWPPPPAWPCPTASPPPPPGPSFWHHHYHQQADPQALTPGIGTYCFPPPTSPLTTTGFGSSLPVPGIPPHGMFTADPDVGSPTGQPARPWPVFDFHPSKESIDEAFGDVISKPWLPLPLGLKAPALDSVLSELQRQGIPKIPPSCA
ncbi:hypothetical protein QN277_008531 [Acacia crassicarpa]|uniref:HTH myb-type domain-containing protein n=1 Tax=Acacia crassicarpa TaxID=499986 RepID=A0AAE1IRN0_9FABA|nr:hypothetical protein QN277_008531 [Acacia crassicarpa]